MITLLLVFLLGLASEVLVSVGSDLVYLHLPGVPHATNMSGSQCPAIRIYDSLYSEYKCQLAETEHTHEAVAFSCQNYHVARGVVKRPSHVYVPGDAPSALAPSRVARLLAAVQVQFGVLA
jgi:hypothetical protein